MIRLWTTAPTLGIILHGKRGNLHKRFKALKRYQSHLDSFIVLSKLKVSWQLVCKGRRVVVLLHLIRTLVIIKR